MFVSFLATLLLAGGGTAPQIDASQTTPWVGERGITETVAEIMERARKNGDFEPRTQVEEVEVQEIEVERDGLPMDPGSPQSAIWPLAVGARSGLSPLQASPAGPGTPNNPQAIGASFLCTQISESGFIPPDTVGSVGPTQVLVCSNGRIKVFDKAGTLGGLNVSSNTFFNSVRNNSTSSDPQVKYDKLSGRWFVIMINVTSPNRIMLAVSSGSTITNQASFTFYQFTQDQVAPVGNAGQLADYPKAGVDANAITIGANMFGANFAGTSAWVIRKTSVLSGGPIVVTALRGLVPTAGSAGPFAPSGVDNDDPAATVSYIVGVDNSVFGRLVLRKISNPGGSPTVGGNLNVTVPATTNPIGQVCVGSNTLDSLDDRLFACQIHKNRITGVRSLWTAHNIQVNSSGTASSSGGRNGSRWYEVGNIDTTPTLTQSGTLFDPAASNPRGYWIPSIAISGQGHAVLGTSYANATVDHASIATSGRLSTDALGTIQAPTQAVVSTFNYVQGSRWGDYSAVMVDPSDDQTLWAFAEYANANNSWGVRAIQLRAPVPATPSSINPPTVAPGTSNINLIVTGTSVSGSGFYDTEPGVNRIAAAFSGTGITVNSITWTSPTQLTLNVTTSGAASPGQRNLTITNPDGQQATGNNVLTVGVGDCNGNTIPDNIDIQNGTSQDCDSNGVPDECQPDADGDGHIDACDGCPNDPLKIAPGHCGCGVAETPDTDGDGTFDCLDGCPNDPAKTAPGQCGCGNPDTDSDGDGTANCNDGCPSDPGKTAPGQCGCGTPDTDSDNDGTANCHDGCPNDPAKTAPGICGCGVSDADSDGDGTVNCLDGCPNDPLKTAPGQCGCGLADTDTDADGIADCNDNCPSVANPDQTDCNFDGNGDACEIADGAPDCNGNGALDDCDIGSGVSADVNGNHVPDECETVGTAYCFGDGSGGTCPCSNFGDPGHGCQNSVGTSAVLSGGRHDEPGHAEALRLGHAAHFVLRVHPGHDERRAVPLRRRPALRRRDPEAALRQERDRRQGVGAAGRRALDHRALGGPRRSDLERIDALLHRVLPRPEPELLPRASGRDVQRDELGIDRLVGPRPGRQTRSNESGRVGRPGRTDRVASVHPVGRNERGRVERPAPDPFRHPASAGSRQRFPSPFSRRASVPGRVRSHDTSFSRRAASSSFPRARAASSSVFR
jgi:hypothetical protein